MSRSWSLSGDLVIHKIMLSDYDFKKNTVGIENPFTKTIIWRNQLEENPQCVEFNRLQTVI